MSATKICWEIGGSQYRVSRGDLACDPGWIEYSGPMEWLGDVLLVRWDAALGAPRPFTAEETLHLVKEQKVAELRTEREAHVTSLYSSVVVEDAALGIPSEAFKTKVISDRTQCALDLKAALDAVSAATTPAEVSAVAITWTITAGADPDAPEYAV